GNYNGSSATKTITISKHDSSVAITWADSTYNSSPNAATATVSGVAIDGDLLPHPTFEYYTGSAAGLAGSGTPVAPTAAGTYTLRDALPIYGNYNGSSATK